jgi:hypothetical protein
VGAALAANIRHKKSPNLPADPLAAEWQMQIDL